MQKIDNQAKDLFKTGGILAGVFSLPALPVLVAFLLQALGTS